jgi:predicted small metal-binding protein
LEESMKVLYCKDVGFDCEYVAEAESEEDLLQKVAEHAETTHQVSELPDEVVTRVRAAIRDA